MSTQLQIEIIINIAAFWLGLFFGYLFGKYVGRRDAMLERRAHDIKEGTTQKASTSRQKKSV